jgi:secondary thiamine-phosphate synthase enzyme
MKQATTILTTRTRGDGFADVTAEVAAWLEKTGIAEGLVTLFIRHTSASLLIQENADPDVLADLRDFLARASSPPREGFRHTTEGPDDMPAHIRAALTQTQLSIPVLGGKLALGTWQAIYLVEHRARPHAREIAAHVIGT